MERVLYISFQKKTREGGERLRRFRRYKKGIRIRSEEKGKDTEKEEG